MAASPRARRIRAGVLAIALAATGCAAPADDDPRPVVVVLQSTDLPEGLDVVSPGVLGFTLALADSGIAVEVVGADPAGRAAAAAAADPRVVAVVVAPFTIAGEAGLGRLATAGVPVLSLSSADAPPSSATPGTWRRWVPDAAAGARGTIEAAQAIAEEGCVLSEPGPWQTSVERALLASAAAVGWRPVGSPAGCEAVLWNGSAGGAAALRDAIAGPLLLTDQARTQRFLERAGPNATRTLGICGCSDLSTTAGAAEQAFVHDYQLATGLDPGPYAAEGYDAGLMVLGAVGETASPTREVLRAALAATSSYRGVAGDYAWLSSGELRGPGVRIYVAEGVRWLPLAGSDGVLDAALPDLGGGA